jgi:formate hydrogenlyase subunit 6/NADH:ubiquinone oxidoreductase subunit I
VASFDHRWLHAQFNLAWKLVRHWLLKLWPWAERFGFARFQENYVPEGLPPSTPDFRLLAHEPGRCTSCRMCDEVCPILLGDVACEDPQFLGPMTFILAATRQAPHLDDVKLTLAALNGPVCSACRKCDATCPERIPIAKLAVVYEEQRMIVERSRQGTLPITDARPPLPPWVGRGG